MEEDIFDTFTMLNWNYFLCLYFYNNLLSFMSTFIASHGESSSDVLIAKEEIHKTGFVLRIRSAALLCHFSLSFPKKTKDFVHYASLSRDIVTFSCRQPWFIRLL